MFEKGFTCALVLTLLVTATASTGTPIPVGTGGNGAMVVINFGDGAIYEFEVSFASQSVTGLALFDIIESETSLTTIRQDFGFGIFIDGISFLNHGDAGFGGGEDWWHYWVADGVGEDWVFPPYGIADRIACDGYSDGWVYGNANTPVVPEPATLGFMGIGISLLLRRRFSAKLMLH